MGLPKWVEEIKEIVNVTDSLTPKETRDILEALSIAWEALERIQDRSKRILSGEVKTREFGAADYSD